MSLCFKDHNLAASVSSPRIIDFLAAAATTTSSFMVRALVTPAAVAAATAAVAPVVLCAHFMWTVSPIHQQIGTVKGLVYIAIPNVIITKILGYNEAA